MLGTKLDLGKLLTVAIEFLEALATDLLENDHLVSLYVIFENGGLYDCALYIGSTDLHCCIICNEEDLLELHISTFGIGKPLHKDFISSFYLELLACNVNDCVHNKLLLKVSTVSVRHRGGS